MEISKCIYHLFHLRFVKGGGAHFFINNNTINSYIYIYIYQHIWKYIMKFHHLRFLTVITKTTFH